MAKILSHPVRKFPAESEWGITLLLCFSCHMSTSVLPCGLLVAMLFMFLHFFLLILLV